MSDFGQGPPGTPPPAWGGTPPPAPGGTPPAPGGTPPPAWGGTPPPAQQPTPPPVAQAAAPKKSKTPAIVLGVLGMLTLFGSCLPFAATAYFVDSADSHRSLASSYEYSTYGGSDPFMADLYRREAEEEEQMSMGSGCCGSMCCLGSIGMLIGAAVMFARKG